MTLTQEVLAWLGMMRHLPFWERRFGLGEAAGQLRFYLGQAWLAVRQYRENVR